MMIKLVNLIISRISHTKDCNSVRVIISLL